MDFENVHPNQMPENEQVVENALDVTKESIVEAMDQPEAEVEPSNEPIKVEAEEPWKEALEAMAEKQQHLLLQVESLKGEWNNLKRNNASTTVANSTLDKFLQDYETMQSQDKSPVELTIELQMEKAARARLQEECLQLTEKKLAFAHQISILEQQIIKHEQTETVLNQTVSHFQHRLKVERAKEGQQEAVFSLGLAQTEIKNLQEQNERLAKDLEEIRVRVDAHETQELVLRNKIQQLETDKAVLQSKADQLQKTEAALRFRLNSAKKHYETTTTVTKEQEQGPSVNDLKRQIAALEKENESLAKDNASLKEKNTELNTIAVELVAQLEQYEDQGSAKRHKHDAE
ncbi:Aste57867_21148 [Aphanomyces stellatus]|uniref:Aste57867_21148 protein n=1 Tax=Aphanomyces stellatus TaxID=120398 RepID=A0A485LI77_9STRA|nr:hypothetical protein As57867_021080 [Aphanomyces stellatus]VFT97822.1 Aste57867_21148 [Aphanomyces stellatus]